MIEIKKISFSSLLFIFLGLTFSACKGQSQKKLSDIEEWKLAWRMLESSLLKNYALAEKQFDSLNYKENKIDIEFIKCGLGIKQKLKKNNELAEIFKSIPDNELYFICDDLELSELEQCKCCNKEKIENKDLQIQLIKMQIEDQLSRNGNVEELAQKYNIEIDKTKSRSVPEIDSSNQLQLIQIINNYGFPAKKEVGIDGMNSVFLIIQHADRNTSWQKSQLDNIENSVKNKDLPADKYAYLVDRININSGKKQIFGTQVKNININESKVEYHPIQDTLDLDKRRKELGLMPISTYNRIMINTYLNKY